MTAQALARYAAATMASWAEASAATDDARPRAVISRGEAAATVCLAVLCPAD